jgi:hypothetical protein
MKNQLRTTTILLLLLIAAAANAASQGRWELLGERDVDFRNDHDTIDVGRHEGKFKELQIRVKDAPIEVSNFVVTFDNDQKFNPKIKQRFAEGSGTRNIDLPGNSRIIKRIDFTYHSINRREGRGKVQVYGR